MYYRICVQPAGRAGNEGERQGIVHDAHSLGITALRDVHTRTLYFLHGDLTAQQVELLCARPPFAANGAPRCLATQMPVASTADPRRR